jgi:membrane protein DedA with SNARE-associated domain
VRDRVTLPFGGRAMTRGEIALFLFIFALVYGGTVVPRFGGWVGRRFQSKPKQDGSS